MRTYKPDKKYNLTNSLVLLSIIFLTVTLPTIIEGPPFDPGTLIGLGGFWLMGIALSVIPLGFKMEVERGRVRTYFLGLCIRDLKSDNVRSLEYGNLFRGGLGVGKGVKGWEQVAGKHKYFNIGEKFWGKEAMQDAQRILSPRR